MAEIFGVLKEFLRVGGFFYNFEGFQQPEFKNILRKRELLQLCSCH